MGHGLGGVFISSVTPKILRKAALDLLGGSHPPAGPSTVIGLLRATPLWQDPVLVVGGPRDESGDAFRELRVCIVGGKPWLQCRFFSGCLLQRAERSGSSSAQNAALTNVPSPRRAGTRVPSMSNNSLLCFCTCTIGNLF